MSSTSTGKVISASVFSKYELVKVERISPNAKLYRFALPAPDDTLDLPSTSLAYSISTTITVYHYLSVIHSLWFLLFE